MHSFFALLLGILLFFGPAHDNDANELKNELKKASKELKQVELKVHQLQEKLAFQQIKVIQRELEYFKDEIDKIEVVSEEKMHALFHQERALLAEIIKKIPPCASEAQNVLDQILSVITLLSDKV